MRKLIISLLILIPAITLGLAITQTPNNRVESATASNFKPGDIIHNAVFTAKDSMSVNQIQTFLNSKVPTCDTNGTEGPYAGYPTRADYGRSKGVPPPYICLKDYTQGGKTAAQIIYDKSQQFAISPKVLIVLLQKEQGLVTDEWPWPVQYRSATGYGCPDGAACDSEYYGFTNQVHNAAKMFRKIIDKDPNWYAPYRTGTNTIKWHPSSSCGTSQVDIVNQATAALYSYTPYRPNSAALNNLYGTGNTCSSYGNRNFWRDFVDWFGATHATKPWAWSLVSADAYTNSARTTKFTNEVAIAPSQTAYLRVKALNQGYNNWEKTFTRLGTDKPRDRTSQFSNSDWVSSNRAATLVEDVIKPGEIGTFEFTITAPTSTGSYTENFNILAEDKSWLNDQSLTFDIDVVSPVVSSSPEESAQLATNTSLEPGEYIISPDTHSVLTLQKDGNLALYIDGKAKWSANTSGKNPSRLVMQSDGNLVLYNTNNVAIWHTRTNGNSGAKLVLQTDGNLVIYKGSTPLWFTGTVNRPSHLSHVAKSLRKVGMLYPGQQMETADRRYKLVMQSDGNLVLYSPSRAIWHTRTNGKPVHHFVLQGDGNMVLYDADFRALWNSRTSRKGGVTLTAQSDGNLVLYNSAGKAVWHTRTNGQE